MLTFMTLALLAPQPAAPAPRQEVQRWLSRGYGVLVEERGDELRLYEHRALGDLHWVTLARDPGGAGRFAGEFEGKHVEVSLVPGPEGEAVLDWDVSSHPLALRATALAPGLPTRAQREDPLFNFDWFAASFAEHYAFFETRGIDWGAATTAARGRLSPESTPDELFAVLAELLRPLHDGHCSLSRPGDFAGSDHVDPDPAASSRLGEFLRLIDEQYLDGEERALEDRLTWGTLLDDVAYLRLDAMEGLVRGAGHDEGLAALEAQLEQVFERFEDARALVVDVRFNGGGSDRYGFALAARLFGEEGLVVEKHVHDSSSAPASLWRQGEFRVRPAAGSRFRGPVALLVSRQTASAAEVFGMAMLQREPRVHVLGEQSASVFSDMHPSTLPNGWSLTLSNEVYLTPDGRCFEAVGLPLDLELPTLRSEHLEEQRDPLLEAAVDLLLAD